MDLIKRLRHRFILLAALSIFIIVSVALLSINWMSARSMQDSCFKTMNRIADNGGVMPMREGHYPAATTWFIDSDWMMSHGNRITLPGISVSFLTGETR